MVIPSIELQKSIYTALSSGNYSVYEIVPPNTPMPHIMIGDEVLTYSNTKTNTRSVHNITIHTWVNGESSAESKTINDFVIQTILSNLTVNGFFIDMVTLELLTTMKDTGSNNRSISGGTGIDGTLFHGVLQFQIILSN